VTRFLLGELLLVAMVVSLGAAARAGRRILLPAAQGPTAWVADATLALSALVVLAEILGSFGAFRLAPMAACTVALGAGGWGILRTRQPTVATPPHSVLRPPRAVYWTGLCGCALVLAQWGAWTATPLKLGMTDYDSLNYHLTFAAGFVQTGSIAPLHYVSPDSPVHLYPQTSELLVALGMMLTKSDLLPVFLNLGWLILAIISGWAIGRRFGLGPVTGLAVAAVMAEPVMAKSQAGTAGNDAAALALVLAALAILIDARDTPGPLFVGGLAAGLAISTKLTVIAPAILLGIAVLVRAVPRRHGRAAIAWVGGAAITGCYWYVRDLVITGSPDPAVHLGFFTYAPFRLVNDYGFSVAHYWDRPHVWLHMLIPGLASLGDAWPGLLAAVAVAVGIALFRRRGLFRFMGVVTTVSTAVYLITPTTAIGFDGGPSLYSQNLRYLTPALAVGLILVSLFGRERRHRLQLAIAGLIGLIVVVTLLPGSWAPWPSSKYPNTAIALAVIAALVFLAGSTLPALLPTLRARFGRHAPGVVGLTLLCGVVVIGAAVNRSYQKTRYSQDPLYSWVDSHLHHARVAIAGFDRQYPLYGPQWTNHVQYIGTTQPHGGFTVARDCRSWRSELAAGHYGYVVIRDDLPIEYARGVPELAWTVTIPGVKGAFAGGGAFVLRLTETPDPAQCPPGSSVRPGAPNPRRSLGSPAA
jgi:hypothetical protein